jgi:hypothetical protein
MASEIANIYDVFNSVISFLNYYVFSLSPIPYYFMFFEIIAPPLKVNSIVIGPRCRL